MFFFNFREIPSFIDYLSYTLHFQTVLTGPLCFYTDYQKFINGENQIVKGKKYVNIKSFI